jgi:hypothetical protein
MDFVFRSLPRNGSTVPVDAEIEIYFLNDINIKALDTSKIFLSNLTDSVYVPINYEYDHRILKIKPTVELKSNHHYQIQLLGGPKGIQDILGNTMDLTYMSEFTTEKNKQIAAPELLTPSNDTIIHQLPSISWKPVDRADYYLVELSTSRDFHVIVWPETTEFLKIHETSIIPDVDLAQGNYYLRVIAVDSSGKQSDYSQIIQFYYSPVSASPNDPTLPEGPEDDMSGITVQTKLTALQPKTQLEAIQNASDDPMIPIDAFDIDSSVPKDQTNNVPLTRLNALIINFNQNISTESVTDQSCYLVAEKN